MNRYSDSIVELIRLYGLELYIAYKSDDGIVYFWECSIVRTSPEFIHYKIERSGDLDEAINKAFCNYNDNILENIN